MTDDIPSGEGQSSDRAWLLEPPGPREVHLYVESGEGVEVSAEFRQALETLVRELQGTEVEGFAASCPDLSRCKSYECTLGACQPQTKSPVCYAHERCKIAQMW